MLVHLTSAINAFKGLLESADKHRAGAVFMLAEGLLALAAIWLLRH